MTLPVVIGISGPARSGKDTAADYFTSLGYERYSFAMPLKQGLRGMLGLTFDHTDGLLKDLPVEPFGVSPRRMMQTIGTEWGRILINDRIWLLRAEQVIKEWQAEDPDFVGVVISDVRFDNEAAWVREQGGLVVHLDRPGLVSVQGVRRTWRERLLSSPWHPWKATKPHPSEARVARHPDDYQAYNNGTIEELHDQLDDILRHYVDGGIGASERQQCRVSG